MGEFRSLPTSILLWSLIPGIFVQAFSPTSKASNHFSNTPGFRPLSFKAASPSPFRLQISAASQDGQETRPAPPEDGNNNNNNSPDKSLEYDDSIRRGLRRLAQLSLEDYAWRMSVFKEKEADRRMEEYLGSIMGEEPSYVRPMDASESKIGPLVSMRRCGCRMGYD